MAVSTRPETEDAGGERRNRPNTGSPFDDLTLEDVRSLIDESLPDGAEENALFYSGDHWQEGDGWVGPTPPEDDSDYDTTLDLIETQFTSRNVIREIVKRRTRGIVGREPRFAVVPRAVLAPDAELSDEQKKAKLEIEAALTDWWNARRVHEVFQAAVAKASYMSRAPLRLYVPRGRLVNDRVPKQTTLAGALSFLYIESPEPEYAAVIVDDETKDECGVLLTKNDDGKTRCELVYLASTDTNGVRQTVIRIFDEDTDEGGGDVFRFNWGGNITMTEIAAELLITEQQRQMQRALNLCLTMIPHNIVTGGFLERIILNGLPPGHWEESESGSRARRFVPEPFVTGSGVTSWVRGLTVPQKDGSTLLSTPSVVHRDPVNPSFASDAKRSIYQDMLEEADQAHVLISGDAVASGKSREQARADHEMSLMDLAAPTTSAGTWLIDLVLSTAAALMGQPNRYREWRGQFECRISTGPISITERQQNVAEVEKGLLSEETAMERNGVPDVAAETARIAVSPSRKTSLRKTQSEITLNMANAGADLEAAAVFAGVDEDEAADLIPDDVPETEGDPDADPDVDPDNPPAPEGDPVPPGPTPPNTGDE